MTSGGLPRTMLSQPSSLLCGEYLHELETKLRPASMDDSLEVVDLLTELDERRPIW